MLCWAFTSHVSNALHLHFQLAKTTNPEFEIIAQNLSMVKHKGE